MMRGWVSLEPRVPLGNPAGRRGSVRRHPGSHPEYLFHNFHTAAHPGRLDGRFCDFVVS